ncbi:MAG: RNA polymerase sigma factor [Candidatus Doudnabacteria bacterium]|nr:RNA polymerase sigma factor [Candidatus Doudnabacteria bacterium]
MESLEVLVRNAHSGDKEAFRELYEFFADPIFRFIKLKIQSQQEAEDILQDVFLKAWLALPKFRLEQANFRAWLYRIASNAVTDNFRKRYRSPQTLELFDGFDAATTDSVAESVGLRLDAKSVRQMFSRLPANYRAVLELRFVEDFSVKETAKILKKSRLAIRLIQYRGLQKLRDYMEKQYDIQYSKI